MNNSKDKFSWVAPTFEEAEINKFSLSPPKTKKKKLNNETAVPLKKVNSFEARISNLTWLDKYSPHCRSELAVHSKKVDDVFEWLKWALKQNNQVPILLMTGPPGSGKTATLKVGAIELNVLLKEWISPPIKYNAIENLERDKTFDLTYKSEVRLVEEFLIKSSRFPSLLTQENNYEQSVVLIEDIPSVFHKQPNNFVELLLKYSEIGKFPLVCIISDEKLYQKLTSDAMFSRMSFSVIEFNPVAKTIVNKTLNNIVNEERKYNNQMYLPKKDELNSIYESCFGDLRAAINTLQFICTKSSEVKQIKPKTISKVNSNEAVSNLQGRDKPHDFFRIIGRVLYAKRDSPIKGQNKRGNLTHNPYNLVEENIFCFEFVTRFMQENYLHHFSNDTKAAALASDYLALSDVITNYTFVTDDNLSKQLGFSVSVCGLMYSHPSQLNTKQKTGFKPHKKPKSKDVENIYNERKTKSRMDFPMMNASSYDLLTEILPFMKLIESPSSSSEYDDNIRICDKFKPFAGSSVSNVKYVNNMLNSTFTTSNFEINEDIKLIVNIDSD